MTCNRYMLCLISVFILMVSTPIVLAEIQSAQPLLSVSDVFTGKKDQNLSIATELSAVINAKSHPYLAHAGFSNRAEDLAALYKLADNKLL